MFTFYEDPKTTFQHFANGCGILFFILPCVIWFGAATIKSNRDAEIVSTIDAGFFKSASVGSGPVSGTIINGMGVISSDPIMTVETTAGVYIINGQHSFNAAEPMRIQQLRGDKRNLCTNTFCEQIK